MGNTKDMNYFLIDGFNMAFRCFYAMPDLTRSDGFPTGALHAFFASLLKLGAIDAPHATCVFFDSGGSIRHRKLLPTYKANRAQAPETFKRQIEPMKTLCSLLGFDVFGREGIEADDLLASLAVKLKNSGHSVTIVSADKDFAQLVSPNMRQLLPPNPRLKEWSALDTVGVRMKFGVSPSQIPDFLALVGDSADNIPGLEGIGPKTAAKWLKEYGDLQGIIRRYDWLKPEKFRTIVRDSQAMLARNLELVRLDTKLDIETPQNRNPDFDGIIKFLEDMEMKKALTGLRKFAKDQHGVLI